MFVNKYTEQPSAAAVNKDDNLLLVRDMHSYNYVEIPLKEMQYHFISKKLVPILVWSRQIFAEEIKHYRKALLAACPYTVKILPNHHDLITKWRRIIYIPDYSMIRHDLAVLPNKLPGNHYRNQLRQTIYILCGFSDILMFQVVNLYDYNKCLYPQIQIYDTATEWGKDV